MKTETDKQAHARIREENRRRRKAREKGVLYVLAQVEPHLQAAAAVLDALFPGDLDVPRALGDDLIHDTRDAIRRQLGLFDFGLYPELESFPVVADLDFPEAVNRKPTLTLVPGGK
ncbi:MAG: hypothetical protein ACLPJH_16915 [Myxococcaceae bacterium]